VASALAVADDHAGRAARVLAEAEIDEKVAGALDRLSRSIIDRSRSAATAGPGVRAG
jgi:hypothetical protein